MARSAELGLADVFTARRRIEPYLRPTPLIRPLALGRALEAEVHLKLENLQPIGAFKVRGGINLVSAELAELRGRRLFAASTGNHGQSVAYAAREFGLAATIYAPEGANALKVASMRALGAEVVLTGRDFDAAREACEAAAAASGARYVHSMEEPLLIAGVGTAYLEAIEEVPDADLLIVPVGGGSGASGAGLVAKSINPRIRVVGVQAEGAPAVYLSYRSGRLETTERMETRAEGLATRQAFGLPLAMIRKFVDDIVLVSDAEMEDAMRLLMETAHVVAEMAGAAPLAAARKIGVKGQKVILPVSGGNATREQLAAVWRSA